jgi:hypothetical protein
MLEAARGSRIFEPKILRVKYTAPIKLNYKKIVRRSENLIFSVT